MERGLYIAAAGMLAEQVRQDQIANDLANASTAGYKADRAVQSSFADALVSNSATGQTVGSFSLGSRIERIVTDMSQGALSQTGDPLDVGLAGDGFFAVSTPGGVRYTRDGQLSIDPQGRLETTTGYTLLGANGQPIDVSRATGPDDVTIDPTGVVKVKDNVVGKIAIVSLTGAAKQGDSLFTGTPGAAPAGTTVQQGTLEGSGVNPATTMVDMIVSLRAYESTQRVIHAIDDDLGRAVTSVGSATG
ncbi:MAG: flagellar hook-basal body protein [Gaiellales bacterium]